MAVIRIPKPPADAYNPSRPISSLIKVQLEHLHEAEKRLPSRYHSEIYINAIKTEGEAANYIRLVTEAIHSAHADAERARHAPRPKPRGIEIAAVADDRAERQFQASLKRKSSSKKSTSKKARTKKKQ